jgi:hypothetical protein
MSDLSREEMKAELARIAARMKQRERQAEAERHGVNGAATEHQEQTQPNGSGDGAGAKQQEGSEQDEATDLGEWDAGDDTGVPPPRQWLLGNQFCRGFLSGLPAPGATGKTATRTLQYLSLAIGRALSGQHVFKRSRVLVVGLEDDKNEMRRRIAAACIHHNIDRAELKGWLFCANPKGLKLAESRNGTFCVGKLMDVLRAAIERRQPDLLALDPFVKLHSLAENDNTSMDFVADLLVQLADEYNIAVDAPHHTRKGLIAAGDADAGRGASAARDAGRLVYTLTRMTEDEAKAFSISPEDRDLYVRLDSGKVNIARPARGATWFKLIGVPLGNGTAEYPNGDEVQTVEPWNPPKTWEGLSSVALNAALTVIDAGMDNGRRYSSSSAATDRAAWPVVQRHCTDRSEAQCREIISTWVKNGVLYNEEYDDPGQRRKQKGLRLDPTKRPS